MRSIRLLGFLSAGLLAMAGAAQADNFVTADIINHPMGTPFNIGDPIQVEFKLSFNNFAGGGQLEFLFPRDLLSYESWQFGPDFPENNEAACDGLTGSDQDDCLAENLHFSEGPESQFFNEDPRTGRARALVGGFDPFKGDKVIGILTLRAIAAGDGSVTPKPDVEFQTASGNDLVVTYSGAIFTSPEPGTLLLLVSGLGGLGIHGRKHRRR